MPTGAIIRDVVATAHVAARGISPAKLAARGRRNIRRLDVSPGELTRWLLEQQLVTEHDGLLQPTDRGREIGLLLGRDRRSWLSSTARWRPVTLLGVVAVLGGLSPFEPPVDIASGRVPPLAHPVLEAR